MNNTTPFPSTERERELEHEVKTMAELYAVACQRIVKLQADLFAAHSYDRQSACVECRL